MIESIPIDRDEILIVDDATANLQLLSEILGNAGYKVRSASDGQAALRSAKAKPPGLILLDIEMPGMDGFEICRQLKADTKTSLFPVIFIGISGEEQSKIKVFQTGGVDFITQPFYAEEVLARVKTHLSLSQLQSKLKNNNARLEKEIYEREHAENALFAEKERLANEIIRESETRYRTIVDNSFEGIILQDASGKITTWNKAAERIFGITEEEAVSHTSTSREWSTMREDGSPFPGSEHPSMVSLTTGKPCNDVVMGVKNSSGVVSWININTNPLFADDTSKPSAVVITFSDITELKQAKAAAFNAAKDWQTTFDTISSAIWILDGSQRILRANKAAERLCHQSNGKMIGQQCWQLAHGTNCPIDGCPLLKAKKSLHQETMDLQLGDGWFQVTVDPILDPAGKFSGAIHIISDITERKRMEVALRESEDKFKHIFDFSAAGKSITMPTGEMEVNQAFCQMLGYSPAEFKNRKWQDISHPDDIEYTRNEVQPLLSGEKHSARFIKRYLHKNGSIVWGDVNTYLRRNADGKPQYFITTVYDITQRMLTEKALEKSEEEFRGMVETMPVAIYVSVGIEQRGTYVNPEFIRLFGYTLEDIPSIELWWPLAYPDEHYRQEISRKWNRKVKQAIETQTPIEPMKVVVTCKDGTKKDISWGYITLGDKNYAYGLDLTERKQAEEAQQKIAERLSLACRAGGIGIWELDIVNNQLIWDDQMFHLYGIKPDQFSDTYQTWRASVHPDDLRKIEEEFQLTLSGRKDFDTEFRIIRPDGTIHDIRAFAVAQRDASDRVIKLIGTNYNITQRKKADMERMQLLHVLESSLNEIYIFDAASLVFEYVNRAALHNLGYTSDAILTMTPVDLKPEFTETTFRRSLDPLLQGKKEILLFETIHRRHDGSTYPVEVHLQLVKFKDQPAFLAVIMDISGRKHDEKERKKLEAQLQQAQKMESVGRLAGGVAHDFNNMLSVILGYGNMILEKTRPDDFFHECAQEILNAGVRSADITRQLLAFARKQTIAPRILDLNDTVTNMLKMLKRLIGEDIELVWQPSTVWPVSIDPAQLDQILANLCVNARDAIIGVGKITIETGNTILDEVYCSEHTGFTPGQFVLLSISDNGCGMDKNVMNNLFEPFFTTKELGKGTGLGLATVYGIVKQNNGFINVYSETDKGTTFRIYIPRHSRQGNTSEQQSEEMIPHGKGETILVVEDEASVLRLIAKTLKNLGYAVMTANSSKDAVNLAKEADGKIDLLLTDVIMPEMNGQDLAKALSALYPGLKCLFMSGYTSTVIASHGVLEEGVRFIQKPFSEANLAIKVKEALGI
jgi:two-component system, cell cycle sensor histidine kinase and response regulator CckA